MNQELRTTFEQYFDFAFIVQGQENSWLGLEFENGCNCILLQAVQAGFLLGASY